VFALFGWKAVRAPRGRSDRSHRPAWTPASGRAPRRASRLSSAARFPIELRGCNRPSRHSITVHPGWRCTWSLRAWRVSPARGTPGPGSASGAGRAGRKPGGHERCEGRDDRWRPKSRRADRLRGPGEEKPAPAEALAAELHLWGGGRLERGVAGSCAAAGGAGRDAPAGAGRRADLLSDARSRRCAGPCTGLRIGAGTAAPRRRSGRWGRRPVTRPGRRQDRSRTDHVARGFLYQPPRAGAQPAGQPQESAVARRRRRSSRPNSARAPRARAGPPGPGTAEPGVGLALGVAVGVTVGVEVGATPPSS
jgi:hypothetical protein